MEKVILYRKLMKACRRFQDYNFREYFLRKCREDFREPIWNPENSKSLLATIQRQTVIQSLYPSQRSIIEQKINPSLGRSL